MALLLMGGCGVAEGGRDECGGCHQSLEPASSSHPGCASCHGGDAAARTKEKGHAGMLLAEGGLGVEAWDRACGACHRDQVGRMAGSQMFTNAGMIAQIQATWEGTENSARYASVGGAHWNELGKTEEIAPVAELENLSGELYRKFCARCHLAGAADDSENAGHPSGCAACHFPYGEGDTYDGADRTVRGAGPHSATHAMEALPPMAACERCHNRSGRIALSYQGLQDGNNAMVPTRQGRPGPASGSDGRTFTHITPDVHFDAGMECIDCHTSREIMGDGYSYASMEGQLEIGCEDCHGGPAGPPRFAAVTRESDGPVRESRRYARPVSPGMKMALTKKGRPYSNVFQRGSSVIVATKRTGKPLTSPVISGTAAHSVAGHGRLECATCHSRAVPQCFGCHTTYDKREESWDFIRDEGTSGAFSEREDYRTLYPFPIALNGRDGIAPVTPGCQTFVTVIEPDGSRSLDEAILRYGDRSQLRFVPFHAHNTGSRAVGCAECHGNPSFLGFGQHVIEEGAIRSTLLCERNPRKGLDAFLSMDGERVVSHAAIARSGARPLDHEEVRRVLAVNLCLVCHPRADDPIYRTRLDYDALDDDLHRRLLAGGR